MFELAEKLRLPMAQTPIFFTPRHPDACDARTFVWDMGAEAKSFAADLDELFYEILPETQPKKLVNV